MRSEDPEDWLNPAPGAGTNGASWAKMRDLARPRTRGGAAAPRGSSPWAGTLQPPPARGTLPPPPTAGAQPPRVVPHAPGTPLPLSSVRDTATVEDDAARHTAPKVFRFKARTEAAETVEGHLTAFSRERAVEILFQRKYTPLEVVEVHPDKALGARQEKPLRASRQSVAIFTRQLSILYRSGVPIVRALDALSRTPDDLAMSLVITDVRNCVYNGFPMSRAMQRHSACFPPEYAAMVEAGELAGTLDSVLDRLASNLERQVQLFARVKSVMNYPALVTALAIGINLFIFKWILPQFEPIFASSGVALPFLTAAIMQMVRWTNSPMFWVVAAAIPAGLFVLSRALKKNPRLREPIDHLMLRLPLVGPIYHRLILTEIFSIMFNLYSAGINIQRTLVLASRVANNRIYEKALLSIAERVKEGDSLASAFKKQSSLFTRLVVQMIATGETTGKPAMGFRFLTDFYKAELEYILDGLAATLEPLLIGIVGIMTGTVVMAVFLPIYRIVSAMM